MFDFQKMRHFFGILNHCDLVSFMLIELLFRAVSCCSFDTFLSASAKTRSFLKGCATYFFVIRLLTLTVLKVVFTALLDHQHVANISRPIFKRREKTPKHICCGSATIFTVKSTRHFSFKLFFFSFVSLSSTN